MEGLGLGLIILIFRSSTDRLVGAVVPGLRSPAVRDEVGPTARLKDIPLSTDHRSNGPLKPAPAFSPSTDRSVGPQALGPRTQSLRPYRNLNL